MSARTLLLSALCAIGIVLSASVVMAGGVMQFNTVTVVNVGASYSSVETNIFEQVAVTTTRQTFINPSSTDTASIVYGIALNQSAMVTSIRWNANDSWFVGTIGSTDSNDRGTGQGNSVDVFVRNFGSSSFIFPFGNKLVPSDTIVVEVTSVELLPYSGGTIGYTYAIANVPGATASINEWNLSINAQRAIKSFTSPHFNTVSHDTIGRLSGVAKHVNPIGSILSASFVLEYDGLTMNVLSTKPADEDGYAIMTAVPRSSVDQSSILPKRFTFVMDRSGSMSGVKIQQAHQAATYCVQRLNAADEFNVIRFDSKIETLSQQHLPVNSTNVQSAISFIEAGNARGGTDIMGSLTQALRMMKNDSYVNTIVFLTDGLATVDLTKLKQLNTTSTRIFVFGIGSDVSENILTGIALQNNGAVEFIREVSSSVMAIQRLWDKIRDPLVKNPAVLFDPPVVYDVYPTVIPDIYAGEQLMLVGRYTTPGANIITVNGADVHGTVSYRFDAFLTDRPDVNTFVAKVWARGRIDALLDLMKGVAQNSGLWTEWRDEIVRLGLRYGMVTPFTTYTDTGKKDDDQDPPGDVLSVENDALSIAQDRTTVSPNPATVVCDIGIDLSGYESENIKVEIVNTLGELVRVLYSGDCTAGRLDLTWDTTNEVGDRVAAGTYLLVLHIGGEHSSRSIVVLR